MDVGTVLCLSLTKVIGIGVLFIKELIDNLNVISRLHPKWLLTKYNTYYNKKRGVINSPFYFNLITLLVCIQVILFQYPYVQRER